MQAKNRKMGRAMNLHAVKSPISFENIRTETEINDFIARLNQEIKVARSESEKERIQYTRQCAYNRKKKIIKEGQKNDENNDSDNEHHRPSTHNHIFDRVQPELLPRKEEIKEKSVRQSSGINYSDVLIIVKNAAPVALFSICALTSLTFVYMQSVPLYASSGFTNPELCAFGALLMIVGFSLIHAINKSKLALLFCLYASAYEVTLIVKGTVANEITISTDAVSQNPQVIFMKENVVRAQQSYNQSKEKYNDVAGTVYQNSWFKKTQLDPAFEKYSLAQKDLDTKSQALSSRDNNGTTGFLKIMFRLGLIFLCMISIHNLIKVTIKDKQ